jgi:outer membrane protein OmpA-like peptidoglycan-associated protein
MNSKTGNDAFTRTRSTWLTLSGAGVLWVALCAAAFTTIDFGASDAGAESEPSSEAQTQIRVAQLEAEEKLRLDAQIAAAKQREQVAQAAQAELVARAEVAERARLALEAEEQARLEAQGKAAERRRIAAEQARLTAEAEAAEQARLAAEAAAAEQARLAAEAAAAEQARLVAEAAAAEQARLVAEAAAAEQARLAAKAKQAEQKRLATADARKKVTASESENVVINQKARDAAAAEASRIAALARQQRVYESVKTQELGVLGALSSRIRFAPDSATISRQMERILDDIFNPLYLYSEEPILVSIASNEYEGTTKDSLLSRDRGRAIASYLINRGLEKERFRILIESGEDLSTGTHRVRVSAEEVR